MDETDDKQRCNDCMSVFDEGLSECPVCGRDDCLMYPFEPSEEDIHVDEDGERI